MFGGRARYFQCSSKHVCLSCQYRLLLPSARRHTQDPRSYSTRPQEQSRAAEDLATNINTFANVAKQTSKKGGNFRGDGVSKDRSRRPPQSDVVELKKVDDVQKDGARTQRPEETAERNRRPLVRKRRKGGNEGGVSTRDGKTLQARRGGSPQSKSTAENESIPPCETLRTKAHSDGGFSAMTGSDQKEAQPAEEKTQVRRVKSTRSVPHPSASTSGRRRRRQQASAPQIRGKQKQGTQRTSETEKGSSARTLETKKLAMELAGSTGRSDMFEALKNLVQSGRNLKKKYKSSAGQTTDEEAVKAMALFLDLASAVVKGQEVMSDLQSAIAQINAFEKGSLPPSASRHKKKEASSNPTSKGRKKSSREGVSEPTEPKQTGSKPTSSGRKTSSVEGISEPAELMAEAPESASKTDSISANGSLIRLAHITEDGSEMLTETPEMTATEAVQRDRKPRIAKELAPDRHENVRTKERPVRIHKFVVGGERPASAGPRLRKHFAPPTVRRVNTGSQVRRLNTGTSPPRFYSKECLKETRSARIAKRRARREALKKVAKTHALEEVAETDALEEVAGVEAPKNPVEARIPSRESKARAYQKGAQAKAPKGIAEIERILGEIDQRKKTASKAASTMATVKRVLSAKELSITPLEIEQPPVPHLSYGLDRVLFNQGVYQLQDRHSGVFNFDPYLQKIMPVAEFDFNALKEYKTSSRDSVLASLAAEHGKRYIGSTSSMTSCLAHFHYLLSAWRPINLDMLSRAFRDQNNQFTTINKAPSSIFLRRKENDTYAIDADKEHDGANVLMMLGKSMEKLLTLPKDNYERYRKSDERQVSDEDKHSPEAFQFTTMGDFLMRSQLDAHDPRLPGTGMFDLKTRAVVTVRMDSGNFEPMTGYEIESLRGTWKSYEREFYDMMRATMLKYSLQARMGRMDGIFVAYHNVLRIFGFQYVPIHEMDRALHGQEDRCLGDQEFGFSLHLLNELLNMATSRFPGTSLRLHFETQKAPSSPMLVFAEPMEEAEIDEIQDKRKAEIAKFERQMMGIEKSEQEEVGTGEGAAAAEATPSRESSEDSTLDHDFVESEMAETTPPKPLFAAKLVCRSKVDGAYLLPRPKSLKPSNHWEIEYGVSEIADPQQAWREYEACRARRRGALLLDDREDRYMGYIEFLKRLSEEGRANRKRLDEAAAGKELVNFEPMEKSMRV